MIRKTAKRTLFLVMVLYFVFLTLFGVADYLYPDTISRFEGQEVKDALCFSFAPDEGGGRCAGETENARLLAFGFLPVKNVRVTYYAKENVLCGGEIFGVRMNTEGLLVTSIGNVETDKGSVSPGETAGLRQGDLIRAADGVELTSATDFVKIISKSAGKKIDLLITRSGESLTIPLAPALSSDGSGYKAGLWVRDGAAGIGTVTFLDPISGDFAGLGHAVCDADTGCPFPLKSGTVCRASIEGIRKGENGKAGEIRGKLEKENLGTLSANTAHGVFGTFQEKITPANAKSVPIGLRDEVSPGPASLFCTLDSAGKREYKIEIEEIIGKDRDSKNFIVKITDPALLAQTGGIVQGMSGSPIIQNGKLIGAVTHVLVGDPTRGYGIFIENMIDNMPE